MSNLVTIDGVELCDEQQEAYNYVMSSRDPVTVITGAAGTGKSALIKALRDFGGCVVTAMTGKAAMNVDGCTVDALFAYDRVKRRFWSESYQEYVMSNMHSDIIIIDEASMLGNKMADDLFQAADFYKKRLVLIGDWAQASPVKDGWITKSRMLRNYEFIKLLECHRQSDGPYLSALNKLRVGNIDAEVTDVFCSRESDTIPEDTSMIKMYGTNRKAETYNLARLWRHCADNNKRAARLFSKFRDLRKEEKIKNSPRNESFKQNAIESSNMAHGVPVAVGCRLVVTVNEPGASRSFVNGDTGTLLDAICEDGRQLDAAAEEFEKTEKPFYLDTLVVRIDRTDAIIQIPKMTRTSSDPLGNETHSVCGFPVALGYALTIHKAQGMTVDSAWFDMESLSRFPKEGRHGLAYVALSRTRELSGLHLRDWSPEFVYCDPEITQLL